MSLPRPSGIKQPTRIGRPSGLPTTRPQTPANGSNGTSQHPQSNAPASNNRALNAIAKSARGAGFCPEHAEHYAEDVSKVLKGPELVDNETNSEDFKIGDRIWVGGNKPGVIAFVGETQFAPGDWAGIVLDEPIGKNDGSVMGVRYFQCEPKKGVFSRLSKLSYSPESPSRPHSLGYDSVYSESKIPNSDPKIVATSNGTTSGLSRPSSRLGMSASKNLSTSSSSLHKVSSAATTPTGTGGGLKLPGSTSSGVKLGDKVLVSGSKPGILRFIGETDFAKGIWAGVELDEPLGKNDGAVAGKRYFDCKPLHGLFAPIHKVSPAESGLTTPSPHSRTAMSTSMRSSRERSGSQESVSSLSSTASSVSRSRVRLGVTSLANQASKTGQRPNTLNLSATTAALQKALKEKEEHIEQLLKERDLERSEVARAAAHVDEAEGQLSFIKTEQSRMKLETEEQLIKYRAHIADLENEKQELLAFLEEEKRRVEDLQFQLEEETLKDDTDNKGSSANELQVKELERQMKKEKDRADTLEKELNKLKLKLEDQQKTNIEAKSTHNSYLDRIEELVHQLSQAESKIKTFEYSRLEDGAKASHISIELAEKQNRVKELEDQLALQHREMSSMSQKLTDLKEELAASNDKRKKQDEYIKELTDKLRHTENQHKDIMDEIRNVNSNTADLQRQLTANKTKAEELASDRAILELQLAELMKNSGDSSGQLATLNDQLTDRNRKLEGLQNDLLKCSQKLAKTEESYQVLVQEKDREIKELTQNFQDRIVQLQDEISELNSAVEKSKTKTSQLSETYESEKKEALKLKNTEIRDLQQQLSCLNDELGKQQDKTTAHKQLLEKVSLEKEAVQYEKQQAEKHLKRVEGEKNTINTELIQARVDVTKYQEEVERSQKAKLELEERVEKLSLQVEFSAKAKEEAEKCREDLKSQKTEVIQENVALKKECNILKDEIQKKETQLKDKQTEIETLQSESSKKVEELMKISHSEADHLRQELEILTGSLQEMKGQLESRELQLAELQSQVDEGKELAHKMDLLQKEKSEVLKEKEASEDKCRSVMKEVEKQSHRATELQSEVESLKSLKDTLKKEKLVLKDRIQQLETELEQAKTEIENALSKAAAVNNRTENSNYLNLKEEAETATRQVNFLNSVIADLHHKNQELQLRLSAMENSGLLTNGKHTTEATERPTPTRARAPRLFCDLCDMFDLHETEDCPKQATSVSPEPTHYHGDRKSTRPYCEICEELCECGAFSPSTQRDDTASNKVSISPVKECENFYPPPEGFGPEEKPKYLEDMPSTDAKELKSSDFDVEHNKRINTENNGTYNQDYLSAKISNVSCELTEEHFKYYELSLSNSLFNNLLPELYNPPSSITPDILKGCDKGSSLTSTAKTSSSTKMDNEKPCIQLSERNEHNTFTSNSASDNYDHKVNIDLKSENNKSLMKCKPGMYRNYSETLVEILEEHDLDSANSDNTVSTIYEPHTNFSEICLDSIKYHDYAEIEDTKLTAIESHRNLLRTSGSLVDILEEQDSKSLLLRRSPLRLIDSESASSDSLISTIYEQHSINAEICLDSIKLPDDSELEDANNNTIENHGHSLSTSFNVPNNPGSVSVDPGNVFMAISYGTIEVTCGSKIYTAGNNFMNVHGIIRSNNGVEQQVTFERSEDYDGGRKETSADRDYIDRIGKSADRDRIVTSADGNKGDISADGDRIDIPSDGDRIVSSSDGDRIDTSADCDNEIIIPISAIQDPLCRDENFTDNFINSLKDSFTYEKDKVYYGSPENCNSVSPCYIQTNWTPFKVDEDFAKDQYSTLTTIHCSDLTTDLDNGNITMGMFMELAKDTEDTFKCCCIGEKGEDCDLFTQITVEDDEELSGNDTSIDKMSNSAQDTTKDDTDEFFGIIKNSTEKVMGVIKDECIESSGMMRNSTEEVIETIKDDTNESSGIMRNSTEEVIETIKDDTDEFSGKIRNSTKEVIETIKDDTNSGTWEDEAEADQYEEGCKFSKKPQTCQ